MLQSSSIFGEGKSAHHGLPLELSNLLTLFPSIQIYLVIVIASIPFLRPLFKDKKVFTWAYYRSLLARYSHRSHSSGQDRRESAETDDTVCAAKGGNGKSLQSLPHIPKDRFVTTTLRNAGPGMKTEIGMETEMETETRFDSLSTLEEGVGLAR
jgi:hypothetical protein